VSGSLRCALALSCALAFGDALLLADPARAVPLTLVSAPVNPTPPFGHSAFHDASRRGGDDGDLLAWLELDLSVGNANFYDPDTGVLHAAFDLYTDSSFTTLIGTAQATGNVPGAPLSDGVPHNAVVATISWDIDLSASVGGNFYDHLEAGFGPEADHVWEGLVTSFADINYTTSVDGRTPNTWDGTELSLWGATGNFLGSEKGPGGGPGGKGGFGNTSFLGVDFVVETGAPVPEPATALLVGLGLLATTAAARRMRRSP
jgi:hypothetical protein